MKAEEITEQLPAALAAALHAERVTLDPASVRRLAGGAVHELGEGDVLAIPNGVPHEFTAVSDPFQYLVVKVET